ncbi:hypothetical protein LLS47_21330 [Rouxiella badensis]|uniref:Uncharacterized protein n=1 Tax=Rouxiella silvae TaxID=1646373 RepID=A0AA40X390_9GAMM|nr:MULTISPECIES: hypothetical protein [Rouxiella]MBF6637882.1 hypothetical protein [Rouxiella silvae]MCC3735476.1 hypothetical protein [Rouxiella badensis]MCC3760773.1 hypothetical protein [Rouxiella badensis]
MKNTNYDLTTFENVTLRIAPGEYHTFPLVDNKGVFTHFYETQDETSAFIRLIPDVNNPIYALYKKYGKFQILICAFSTKDEINAEAMKIINCSEPFKKTLSNLLNGRMHE